MKLTREEQQLGRLPEVDWVGIGAELGGGLRQLEVEWGVRGSGYCRQGGRGSGWSKVDGRSERGDKEVEDEGKARAGMSRRDEEGSSRWLLGLGGSSGGYGWVCRRSGLGAGQRRG